MNAPIPIEIIGGGLAGLSLGVALLRAGVTVSLSDAGSYPRHRVCGEFIAGLDSTTVAALGLEPMLEDALRHREVAWFLPGSPPRCYRLPSPALGISRWDLDHRLAEAFVAGGGSLRENTRVSDLSPQPGRVFATGRRRGRSPWMGLKAHVPGIPLLRDLELHLGANAYIGLARVGPDAVNVCGLFKVDPGARPPAPVSEPNDPAGPAEHNTRPYWLLLSSLRRAGLERLVDRLDTVPFDPASACAVAALQFDRQVPERGSVAIGDACAAIPPFTGNGMAMAFQSAAVVLGPVLQFARGETTWDDTCRVTNAALRGRFRTRLASAGLLHPFVLQQRRQRWLSVLSAAHLLPFRSLYRILH